MIPDEITDVILALAIGALAHGLPRPHALTVVDPAGVREVLHSTFTILAPLTTRIALLLLPHCTLAAAASQGRTDILALRYRMDMVTDDHLNPAESWTPVVNASRTGHADTLRWLLAHIYIDLTESQVAMAVGAASAEGHITILDILKPMMGPNLGDFISRNDTLVSTVAGGGHVRVLEWWIAETNHRDLFAAPHIATQLTDHGHAEALGWWHATYPQNNLVETWIYEWGIEDLEAFARTAPFSLLRSLLGPACQPNRIDSPVLKWHDRTVLKGLTATGRPDDLTWWVATRGLFHDDLLEMAPSPSLDVRGGVGVTPSTLAWWWSHTGNRVSKLHLPLFSADLVRAAASADRIDVLDWAYAHRLVDRTTVSVHASTVDAISRNQHVSVLTWMRARAIYLPVFTSLQIEDASGRGHTDLLEWFARTALVPFPCAGARGLDEASIHGRRDTLDWWIRASRDRTLPRGRIMLVHTTAAMDLAGGVAVLDWWRHVDHGLALKYSAEALTVASRHAATDVLDWWVASGLPLKYDSGLLASLTQEYHVTSVLDWWWKSGLPLKMTRVLYALRQREARLLAGESVVVNGVLKTWETVQGAPAVGVIKWWEDRVFSSKEGANRIQFVEEELLKVVLSTPTTSQRPLPSSRRSSLMQRIRRALPFQ